MAKNASANTLLTPINPKTGEPPKERIGSANLVATIADRYVDADQQQRSVMRARVQRLLNGNPPWNQDKLDKTGQGDRSNVPFREAEGHVKAREATYCNLLFDVKCLVTCTLTDRKLHDKDYAGVIAGHFHEMLMEWPGFIYNTLLSHQVMVRYGIGPVYFPDDVSWHFKATQNGSFLVDSGEESTVDTLNNCVIRGQYKAHELFWKIFARDEEIEAGITDEDKRATAVEHGWNPDMIIKLVYAANTSETKRRDDQYQTSVWESIEQQIKNNDTMYSDTCSEIIMVRHLFQREYRGGVSHYIVPENYVPPLVDFIYEHVSKYKSFQQVICPFFADIGDGSYHSVKGMGVRLFSHCLVNDRLKNQMIDAVNMKNAIAVQGDMSEIRRVKFGRFVLIPQGVTIVANALSPDIEGTLAVSGALEKSLAQSVGTDYPDMDDESGKAMATATGERLRLSREGKLERTDIMLYYQQRDNLYCEIKRRALLDGLVETDEGYESVKKFKERCKDDGVPAALLNDDQFTVKATRAIGFGSPAKAQETSSQVVSVADHFPEVGKVNAVRDFVAATVGWEHVDRYMPDTDMANDPSNQSSFASLENAIMEDGKSVLVGRDQMHIAHLEVHMEPAQQIAKQFVSTGGVGDNPMQSHDFFLADLHHMAMHLDYMKDDSTRKPEYKKFMKMFDELLKVYHAMDKMVKKLQQQLQANQQAEMQKLAGQGADPKAQAELQKVQAEIALNQAAEAHRQQLAEVKLKHTMDLRDRMTQNRMAMDGQQAQQKMAIEQQQAEAAKAKGVTA